MNRTITPLYQNNQLRIRPYTPEDLEGLYDCVISSKTEMKPYMPWVHDNYSKHDSEIWIEWAKYNWESGRQYDFVIEELATGKFLGGIGLLEVNLAQQTAKLGYWLRTDYTGRGLLTSAAKLICQFAKQQLGLKQLIIYMSQDNVASIAVAKKLGAVFQETKLKYETIHGKAQDCDFYSLTL